ncbi:MAG: hypothetical protein WEB00_03950 [Dehalococcoidia bacterium]
MVQASETDIRVENGVINGGLRHTRNPDGATSSIHNDEIAQRVGFRGGTVAGSYHIDLFPPLLVQAFGPAWFERGSLSLNYLNPTTDGEPVRAFIRQPDKLQDAQVEAWIEREDGMKVAEGSAGAGNPEGPSFLRSRDLNRYAEGEYRILDGVNVGDDTGSGNITLDRGYHERRMEVITDRLEEYEQSMWGGAVVSPAALVHMLYDRPASGIYSSIRKAVGLFGAIEIRHVNGPALVGQDYDVAGKIVGRGQSPKSEYFWFESWLQGNDGARVAEMLMQLRFMKVGSPLYPDLSAG